MGINKQLYEPFKAKFETLATQIPEIDFKKSHDGVFSSTSYNMIEYSTYWARFVHLIDTKAQEQGLEVSTTRARSLKKLQPTIDLVNNLTLEDLKGHGHRYRTMFG